MNDVEMVEFERAGELIRWARMQAGASQREVARAMGLGDTQQKTVFHWERGSREPLASNFIAACQACGFNVVLLPMSEEELARLDAAPVGEEGSLPSQG